MRVERAPARTIFMVRSLPTSSREMRAASTITARGSVARSFDSRSSTSCCWPEETVTGTRYVSATTARPSGERRCAQRSASSLSKETSISLVPSCMMGEATQSPKRTWLMTEPPRCAMPWISLFLTSSPARAAVLASNADVRRVPWPPTPTKLTLIVFIMR